MRIGALDPYLATRGGGERYFLELCLALARAHEVDVLVPPGEDPLTLVDALDQTFGLNLHRLRFLPSRRRTRDIYSSLSAYPAAVSVSNDYPPPLGTHPHVSVLQFPWGVNSWSMIHRWRARRAMGQCDLVVVYSQYVQGWVARSLGYLPTVVSPPVPAILAPPSDAARERLILVVGRFSALGHNKKHEVLIRAFARALPRGMGGWQLVLVGGAGPNDQEYVAALKRTADGLPVEFFPNLERPALEGLYRRASLLWHATGFGEDARAHPERLEHFGIAPVEAMSAGCVPMVVGLGGLTEIVEHNRSGVIWHTTEELIDASVQLALDRRALQRLAEGAIERAKAFSAAVFRERLASVLPPVLRP